MCPVLSTTFERKILITLDNYLEEVGRDNEELNILRYGYEEKFKDLGYLALEREDQSRGEQCEG